VRNPDGTPGGDLCLYDPDHSQATTYVNGGLIMICPSTFSQEGRQSLSDLISSQASISSGTSIDSLITAGGIFMHEMMHWINQGSKCIGIYI
jgi:hypothetical protein